MKIEIKLLEEPNETILTFFAMSYLILLIFIYGMIYKIPFLHFVFGVIIPLGLIYQLCRLKIKTTKK